MGFVQVKEESIFKNLSDLNVSRPFYARKKLALIN